MYITQACQTLTEKLHCVNSVLTSFTSLNIKNVLFFSRQRVGHTMDVLSPFMSVLCHLVWLFQGQSCPRIDVVHPGHAWSSSPACTWHCSLHYLFFQATPLFPHGVTIVDSFLALTVSNSSLFTPALLRTHSFVFFAVHETRRVFLSPFISNVSRRVSSWNCQFIYRIFAKDFNALRSSLLLEVKCF